MPRKYKRSKSVKRSLRKTRGGACNAVPQLPYQQPCSVGGELDAEFAAAMRGGSRNSPYRYRKRSGKKSRSYRRRNTKRKSLRRSKNTRRNKRKSMRGSGFTFNPAPLGDLNLGGLHANVPYNDCCPPNYAPGVAEPTSFGVGNDCAGDGSVAGEVVQTTQAGGAKPCTQPNWEPGCF